MEAEKLVFDMVNTLSYPILLVEKDEEKGWSSSYSNESMEKLLTRLSSTNKVKTDKETKNSQDSTSEKDELDDYILELLKTYSEESHTSTYTLHDVEILNGLYTIHFNQKQNHLLMIFIEIPKEELFDNITFHDLSGTCNAIVVVLDSMGNIVDMNECFSNLVGMAKEEAIGKEFFNTFIPGNLEQLSEYFQEILSEEVYHQHFVTPLKGFEGNLYRINWQISKIVKNEQTYVIAIGSDISKFIEENIDLKRQLTSIKVGFEYFPLAVAYMNANGTFIKMNPRFMKMFNIPKKHDHVMFDQIGVFKKNIGFKKLNEHIGLIKEMSYKINHVIKDEPVKIKVDIRLLQKERTKFYIVVAQEIK